MVNTLAGCEWIKKRQPLCLIGDSGTGKSHMLIALGAEAARQGYRVCCTLATNGTIIETGTGSYRLASTRARAETPAKAG